MNLMLMRQLKQSLKICFTRNIAPQRTRKGLAYRNYPPLTRNIRESTLGTALLAQRKYLRTIDGPGGILDERFGKLAHDRVICVRLISLQHRELRVMGGIRAFVAKIPPQLINSAQTANHQAFKIQLGCYAKRQIRTIGVNKGFEGARARTAMNSIQNRGLNLGEPCIVERAANGSDQ